MTKKVKTKKVLVCRLCDGKTKEFLDLGHTPLPEEFRTKKQLKDPIYTFPLGLSYCQICGHVQLKDEVPVVEIYKKNYFYDYSVTQTGLTHWQNLAADTHKKDQLTKKDLVIDIGSNTGTLLNIFKDQYNTRVLGIDPSPRPVKIARKRGIPTVLNFFSEDVSRKVHQKYGQARSIFCTNTLDHVTDLTDFMKGINILLQDEGRFVVEVPYFPNMLLHNSHTVYHQQIDYMTLIPFKNFLQRLNLNLSDAQLVPLHGGSIRMTITKGKKDSARLKKLLKAEEKLFKNWDAKLTKFAKQVTDHRDGFRKLVTQLKRKGRVVGTGAAAKGVNLLNYASLGPETIDFITEKSPLKVGRYTATGIPIVPDSFLTKHKPEYCLLLAWNFKDEIIKNLNGFTKHGGKFILTIPKVKVLSS